ncbi:UNVERIFIED_CONTAM: hypothetical protein GTU68_007523 [Idotea baltica]|nr:hypothetical protein [Idotea baltica]
MCGIVAYLGDKQAFPIVLKGLKRLEYRGYDSSGIAILSDDMQVIKKKGKVSEMEDFSKSFDLKADIGIGHTRWATHGEPNDVNAHPQVSGNGRYAIVHNGIIENYRVLKTALERLGHVFTSDTDTEVLVHLIEEYQKREGLTTPQAVLKALNKVDGAYAIVVMDRQNPNQLIGARKASPLVLGIGENEFFLASDATPLIDHTKRVIYLDDEELAIVNRDGSFEIRTLKNVLQQPIVEEIELELEALEKSGYDHFMLKEIYQQPFTVADSLRGRSGLEKVIDKVKNADRIIILGCGTSWHAGLIAEYLFEDLARIPTEVEYASEFRYRNPVINKGDVVIAISQSGETADTLAAIKLAKDNGAFIYGIVNSVGSSIARLTDSGSYIHAGPEIGVASTKAFTSQVSILSLMALHLGHERLLKELVAIPGKIETILSQAEKIHYIAGEIQHAQNVLYLGRGYNFPVALEGALKLKEISYVHAEGYPAAEMKHGPIALIDENMPVVIIATNINEYDKIVSNIQEVKARKGIVIAIVNEGEEEIAKFTDYTIEVPRTADPLSPLLSVIPLQLLSYYIAVMRGCNVDQPRNLAKSVTVE